MRSQVNMAAKQYLKARFGHKPPAEFKDIKAKLWGQLQEASEDRQDKFVDDIRSLLLRSNVVPGW